MINTHKNLPNQIETNNLVEAHAATAEDLAARFKVQPIAGLTAQDVAQRKLQFGINKLPSPPQRQAWQVFSAQFKSILILILIGASGLSALLGNLKDAVVILAVGKEPISKIVIVAISSGVVGALIAAPWWFYVSVIRNVLIVNADEDGRIVIQERIGRYLFRTRIWLIKDCRIEPISFMTQKLSNDGIDYRSVYLYLRAKELKELQTLQERLKR